MVVSRSRRVTGSYLQFRDYITASDIETIIELGSRDGKDAVLLRDSFDAQVFSFDGNPNQVRLCQQYLTDQAEIQFVPMDAGEATDAEIPRVRIDEWCEENGVKPDLICMDIQGSEMSALRGCGKLLKHTRHIISQVQFSRLNDTEVIHSDIEEFLKPFEFVEAAAIGVNSHEGVSLYSRKW